jgi:hypothetical protein
LKRIEEANYQPELQTRKLAELRQVIDYCETNCIANPDFFNSTNQQPFSPLRFKQTRQFNSYELADMDQSIAFYALNEIGKAGNLKLQILKQIRPNAIGKAVNKFI